MEKRSRNIAITAVVAVLLVAVIGYVAASQANSCTIQITVQSAHFTETVHYDLYVDGKDIRNADLEPFSPESVTYEYRFSLFDDRKQVEIKAISMGGGLGPNTDSRR